MRRAHRPVLGPGCGGCELVSTARQLSLRRRAWTVGGQLYAASIQMQTKLHNGRTREGRRISNGTDLAHMHFAPHE